MSWKIDRRRLLTGAGAIFALPLLESMVAKTAWAAPSDPRRFVSLYMPNGTYNVKGDAVWYPKAGPLTANLPDVLSPFGSHIADFSVLMHPQSSARDSTGQGAHVSAVTTYLTQRQATDYGSSQCTVPGSSFDQMVADTTQKPLLVLSGGCHTDNPDNTPYDYADYISYKNGQPNQPHKNPVELYNLMFANLVPTPGPVPAGARNRSILDSAMGDIKDLQNKLGKNDNRKLDDYFTSLRALETKLAGGTTNTNGCAPGTAPSQSLNNVDLNGNQSSNYISRVQAFFDMIVLAFKCDLVRSVSFMFDGETAQRQNNPCPPALLYNNASLTAVLHTGISHYGQNGAGGRDKTVSRDRMYLSLFFYLLDALKQAKDPSGSAILDNTIVLQGFGVTDGQHTDAAEGTPVVVGGGRNFMHPGNCFDLGGADMKDLFYTFSRFLNLGWSNFQGSSTVLNV
jgi:hypothetical protein